MLTSLLVLTALGSSIAALRLKKEGGGAVQLSVVEKANSPSPKRERRAHGKRPSASKVVEGMLGGDIQRIHAGMDMKVEEGPPVVNLATLPREERQELFMELASAHRSASRDKVWSSFQETGLDQEFGALTDLEDFQLVELECRRTTCQARLGWDEPEFGKAVYSSLTSAAFGLGCVLHMLPPNAEAIGAQVLFDCRRQRALAESSVAMVAKRGTEDATK